MTTFPTAIQLRMNAMQAMEEIIKCAKRGADEPCTQSHSKVARLASTDDASSARLRTRWEKWNNVKRKIAELAIENEVTEFGSLWESWGCVRPRLVHHRPRIQHIWHNQRSSPDKDDNNGAQ